MAKATWNGKVIAESDTYEVVEGNVYFPSDSVDAQYLQRSEHTTVCGWKGTASYYTLVVDGEKNPNAAWFYPSPKDAARNIEGHIAFWNGVSVER